MRQGVEELPLTGTCDLGTVGRRIGRSRRVELVHGLDEQIIVRGTPGVRHWLGNLREHPESVLHLREPARDLAVSSRELTDELTRRRVAEQACVSSPGRPNSRYSIEDWVAGSVMVILTPATWLQAAGRADAPPGHGAPDTHPGL